MAIKTARDVMDVVAVRGLLLGLRPVDDPRFKPVLLVIRPTHVPRDEVCPALMDALKAWRVEIIEELSRESPHG